MVYLMLEDILSRSSFSFFLYNPVGLKSFKRKIKMNNMLQWKCKRLRARLEEVWLLINKMQPSCICLQEIMLDNPKYNIDRKYWQRSKGEAAIAVRKDIPHRRLNIRTIIQAVALEIQPMEKSKRPLFSIYLPPQDIVWEEEISFQHQ